jgi:uncharacterized protein YndB with AHSA1/START domain
MLSTASEASFGNALLHLCGHPIWGSSKALGLPSGFSRIASGFAARPSSLHSLPRERASAVQSHLITLIMSVVIDADRERVWRSLTEPSELLEWDERILASVGDASGYPFTGQHMRWRYRLGGVPVVLHDHPLEISRLERLSSALKVGSLRFEQTYTLTTESLDPPRTRLGMKLVTTSSVPVVGDVVDRFGVRKMAAERIDHTLRSVQEWCHENP